MRDGHNNQSVRLGDIWDCGVRNVRNDSAVVANPDEEQTRGYDRVKLEVYRENALLKGAELLPC